MINLKEIKKKKEYYLQSFRNKNFSLDNEVQKVIELYDEYLTLINQEQKIRWELNMITNKIKEDFKNSSFLAKAKILSLQAAEFNEKIKNLKTEIDKIASEFPNPTDDDVPIGKNEKDNKIISTHLDELKNKKNAKPHWEIIEEKKLTLNNEASFISGPRHVIYNDKAALVIKALEKFMINNGLKNNFTLIEPPVIVNKIALYNSGQLPKFEEDLFKLDKNQYLIPTAEVPLVNLVANKLFKKDDLPINYIAATNCFRKEAGSAGKDTRGLMRLHQFRKVELVIIGKQEDEKKDFDKIVFTSTSILEKLKLPYQILQLCTGDTPFGSKKTIDIEVWMPGVGIYREIASISSIGDFQSRRMKSRYKDENNNKKFTFTHNGSALAIGRTLAAIIENYRQKNGMIKVPEALLEYLPFSEF